MKTPVSVTLAVFFTSFTILAYEINFTRVFALVQWHNLSALIITMALLGFGTSGSVIAMMQKTIEKKPLHYLRAAVLAFPVSLCMGFILSAQLEFNPYEMTLSPEQAMVMFVYFALMGMGFFMGAAIICLALMQYQIASVYFTNLIGSALGVVFVHGISFLLHPCHLMVVILLISLVPAGVLAHGESVGFKAAAGLIFLFTTAALVLSLSMLDLRQVSPYKPVSAALTLPDAKIIHEAYSPLGVVQVVQARGLRSTSGLSLVSPFQVPVQKAIFFNGQGASPITPYRGRHEGVDYLKSLTAFLPFHLSDSRVNRSALIMGAGGGESILMAILAGFNRIDALEANQNVIDLMNNEFASFSGGIYNRVTVFNQEARTFVRATPNRYDLIELSLIDGYNASASGVYGLNETYLYTVEAIEEYIRCLTDRGMLALTRWTVTPARDNLKMFNTVIAALKKMGVEKIENHLIAVRSLQTLTLVIVKQEISAGLVDSGRDFAGQRLFDMVFYPGMDETEANRHIRLETPVYYRAIKRLLGRDARSFIGGYLFDIRSATDDRPYFYNFFKPVLIDLIRTYGPSQFPVTEWGYLLLLVILVPVLVLSFLLVLFPLFLFKRSGRKTNAGVFVYFSLIGAGFFFVEMPLIQKMPLLLGQPVFAISVIISVLLVFSGLGSRLSGTIFQGRPKILIATVLIACITVVYSLALDSLFVKFARFEFSLRLSLAVFLTAPLGFFMGIPFPAGLALLREGEKDSIPWAWGINGFFSVISILAATLMAIVFGFTVVFTSAALLYLAAGFVSWMFPVFQTAGAGIRTNHPGEKGGSSSRGTAGSISD